MRIWRGSRLHIAFVFNNRNPWGQPIEHVPEFSRSIEPIENTGLEVNTRVHRGAQERAYTPSRS